MPARKGNCCDTVRQTTKQDAYVRGVVFLENLAEDGRSRGGLGIGAGEARSLVVDGVENRRAGVAREVVPVIEAEVVRCLAHVDAIALLDGESVLLRGRDEACHARLSVRAATTERLKHEETHRGSLGGGERIAWFPCRGRAWWWPCRT